MAEEKAHTWVTLGGERIALPDGYMDGVDEEGEVEGYLVETYFAGLESVSEDERGWYNIVADTGGFDTEIRLPFALLEKFGWRHPNRPPVAD